MSSKIKIRQVITPLGKITLYDMHDSKAKELEKKLYDWQYGYYKDGLLVFDHKCPVTEEEIRSLNYIDEIYFYPDENKFEAMIKGKVFKTIISKEYSITNFVER